MIRLSYIFGTIGIVCTVIIYQQKNGKGLLISKLISDAIWFVHYALIGAYSGAAIAVIAIIREAVFIKVDKSKKTSSVWLIVFIILSIAGSIATWKDFYSLLPAIASICAIIGFWIGNPKISRILAYPISLSMLIYDVSGLAYFAIANELFTITSSIIGNVRYDLSRRSIPSANNKEKNNVLH